MNEFEKLKKLRANCFLSYILLTCGTIFSVAALCVAYSQKNMAVGTIYESHIDWQIKTFWLALPYFLMALAPVVGMLSGVIVFSEWLVACSAVVWSLLVIWWVARILYGLITLQKDKAI